MAQAIARRHLAFRLLHQSITEAFDNYMDTGDSSQAANLAANIYEAKSVWATFVSEESECKYVNLELFDKVLIRVMRQKASVFLSVSWQQNMLIQLCLCCLESPQNPTGSLSVQTLVDEFGAQLVSLRTHILGFIQDHDTGENDEMTTTVTRFINLGCFLSAIAADAANRPAYPLHERDLWLLGQIGLDLVSGIMQVDYSFEIQDPIRLGVFKVAIAWFEENEEFLCKELRDLYLCGHRLCSFLDSEELELVDGEAEYPILVVKAEAALLAILRSVKERFNREGLRAILEEYGGYWAEWAQSGLYQA